eukprot:3079-Heterococcus_DN1.PRE.4
MPADNQFFRGQTFSILASKEHQAWLTHIAEWRGGSTSTELPEACNQYFVEPALVDKSKALKSQPCRPFPPVQSYRVLNSHARCALHVIQMIRLLQSRPNLRLYSTDWIEACEDGGFVFPLEDFPYDPREDVPYKRGIGSLDPTLTYASPQSAGVAVQAPTVWSQHSSTGADTTTAFSSTAQSQRSTAESSPRQSANGSMLCVILPPTGTAAEH